MRQDGWVIDVGRLTNSAIGNFICRLSGPARREAIDLLVNLQMAAMRASLGLSDATISKLFGGKPVRGLPGVFEKKGKHIRVYFKYKPGRRLEILDGGLKTTQKRDIHRLRQGRGS